MKNSCKFDKGIAVKVVLWIAAAAVVGTTIFHIVHHQLYCRYRLVPGKSHCGKCGHRKVCKKWHHKDEK